MSVHCDILYLALLPTYLRWHECFMGLNEECRMQVDLQLSLGAVLLQAFHCDNESLVFVVRHEHGPFNRVIDAWRVTGPDRALRIELFETPQARAGWVNESNFKRGLPPLNLSSL